MRHGAFGAAVAAGLFLMACAAQAAYRQAELPLEQFPQEHQYQRDLRAFMATLTAQDFTVERREIQVVETKDPEDLYRMWLLALHVPVVGAATLPPEPFTLKAIEGAKGLVIPTSSSESQMLAWLAKWDYPGNPYRGSKAVKLRAFVLAALDVAMLDYLYEHDPQGADRSDYLGGNLIWIGYSYAAVKDALPAPALAAFEAGIKKQVLRLNQWGPRGSMTDMDLFAPVGLRYISQAMDDAEVKRIAEAYARRLLTPGPAFNAAGYFVDGNCFDTSYNGISLYFSTWAALMSPDWTFARETVDKAFRLRAHLCFPDPVGGFVGPSEMSSRTSGDSPGDQWNFPHRPYAAAMAADEALYTAPMPAMEALQAAPGRVAAGLNGQLATTADYKPSPWREAHWSGSINFAYEHYARGYYARRVQLEKENSPLLRPLYKREGTFVHEFGDAFVIAKFDRFAAAIHTGPVGTPAGHNGLPYGFGGGQLCAFWTPQTGVVVLGRRRGVQGGSAQQPIIDRYDEWRKWPIHAVTGLTAQDELLTSSRIQAPQPATVAGDGQADVVVSGVAPKYNAARTAVSPSGLRYERRFHIGEDGVTVQTKLEGDPGERMTELYETIPVLLRQSDSLKPSVLWFQVGGAWKEATAEATAGVTAVKIDRFDGSVLITFTEPRTVKLSPDPWRDGYMTSAECRTVLVDLIGAAARPADVKSASVEYRVSVP